MHAMVKENDITPFPSVNKYIYSRQNFLQNSAKENSFIVHPFYTALPLCQYDVIGVQTKVVKHGAKCCDICTIYSMRSKNI